MKTNKQVHPDFIKNESVLDDIFVNFETKGTPFGDQERNTLKTFDLDGYIVNVKSFRIPNLINQVAYRFFRKSKAQRSFIYANKLKALNIGTPQPVAFYEEMSVFLFKKSYYVSQQLDCDYTYRDLTKDFDIPDYEIILRAFTRFTFKLHENNILFLGFYSISCSQEEDKVKKIRFGIDFGIDFPNKKNILFYDEAH